METKSRKVFIKEWVSYISGLHSLTPPKKEHYHQLKKHIVELEILVQQIARTKNLK